MQTRLQSLTEAWTHIVVGWLVALLTQILVFPLYNMHISLWENIQIGAIFTVVSLGRGYGLRRLFNKLHG